MTDEQMKWAAAIDIRYFRLLYSICPNCGADFNKFHPTANIYAHFIGACKESTKQAA